VISLGGARLLLPDGTLTAGLVEIDGDRIASVSSAASHQPELFVVPGFIDIQVNGHRDIDVASAAGDDWNRLDQLLLAQGVTAWCPTLVTAPLERYDAPLGRIAHAAAQREDTHEAPSPAIVGAHLEGPFLGGAPGAHSLRDIAPADCAWLSDLPPIVRLVTLAPEADNALAAIAALVDHDVTVALGHSTADFALASAAVQAGARLVTHVFNGMGPLHHREPGLVGVALTDDRLTVSLIADGRHVAAPLVRMTFRAKAPGRVVLVTDAVAWQARSPALHMIDGLPCLPDGTLAGSTLTMDLAVRNAVEFGVAPGDALRAACLSPATLLGHADRGRLSPGSRADVCVLTPDLEPVQVWVGGVLAWER
jgi:N-acetylglucosamine-6-phosphate deacetylase